jgi:hypothetical protein
VDRFRDISDLLIILRLCFVVFEDFQPDDPAVSRCDGLVKIRDPGNVPE